MSTSEKVPHIECPKCGQPLRTGNNNSFECMSPSCDFMLPGTICGHKLVESEKRALVKYGRIPWTWGFESPKTQRPFGAGLALDSDYRLTIQLDALPKDVESRPKCPECGAEMRFHVNKDGEPCLYCPEGENGKSHLWISCRVCNTDIPWKDAVQVIADGVSLTRHELRKNDGTRFSVPLIYDPVKHRIEPYIKGRQQALAGGKTLPCHACEDGTMREYETFYRCNCGFTLWKTAFGHRLTDDELVQIAENGHTEGVVYGLLSKEQKAFNARLVLDQNNRLVPSFAKSCPDFDKVTKGVADAPYLSFTVKHHLLPALYDILSVARGKGHSISNKDLRKVMACRGFMLEDAQMRDYIHVLRVTNVMPTLLADNNGYYLAANVAELKDYRDSLTHRIAEIRDVLKTIDEQISMVENKKK